MKRLVLALAFVSSIAGVQQSRAQAAFPAKPPAPPIPRATGGGECDPWYPQTAKQNGTEGTTGLSLYFMIDGTAKDVAVVKSSGDADLDNAAVACVENTRVGPAKHNGQPIDVVWERLVVWRAHDRSSISIPQLPGKHVPCHAPVFRTHGEVMTIVAFQIGTDGIATNAMVRQSSGNPNLDAIALQCILPSWRFPVATRDGKPIEIDREAGINWNLQ